MKNTTTCIVKKRTGETKEIIVSIDKVAPINKKIEENISGSYDEAIIKKSNFKKDTNQEQYNSTLQKCKDLLFKRNSLLEKISDKCSSTKIYEEIDQIEKELNIEYKTFYILLKKTKKKPRALKKAPLNIISCNSILSIKTRRNRA